jgi:hypothetical protein
LADDATQRASWLPMWGKGGLGDVDKKIQLILQKKIIRLDFFVTFFINEKK